MKRAPILGAPSLSLRSGTGLRAAPAGKEKALAWGYVTEAAISADVAHLDTVIAALWKLTH